MNSTIRRLAKAARATGRAKELRTVIFFVTSRCNAACETCFYHEELNLPGDLSFAQIEKMSATMPEITDLWLSGGEPTLRKDLLEIIATFAANNGIRRLIIPTNGLIKERVYKIVEGALDDNPGIEELYLNIALDGYGETHDKVRGVPGNWKRTLATIEHLYPLKRRFGGRLRLNVNTVVCSENHTEMGRLADFLWENFELDGQYFNIVRGETKAGEEIKEVPESALPGIYRKAAEVTGKYADRMFGADGAGMRIFKTAAYVGTILTHYRHQHANFSRETAWSFPCTAGETIAVVDYNGDVRACELLGKFASLNEFDYDFSELWRSRARQEELRKIDGGKACWCTHVCFIHSSLQHSRKGLLVDVPKNYLTRGNWK